MAFSSLEIDAHEVQGLAETLKRAERKAPLAIVRAIKRTGDMSKVRVVRALTKQTGLKRDVIVRAVKAKPAGMSYSLHSRGGNVHLKYFKARPTKKGVSAAPWNKRRIFAGTFIAHAKGGGAMFGGQVFKRTGASRLPIEAQRSGLYIPKEMISGATAAEFLAAVRTILPVRLQHELARILGGAG
ncbi:hypothetical protein [Bradyrhizobium sp. SZCCHNR1020]|uniref:hypothetical protein n=1 Tax=Bradyrhizobium sp. SZCCHNR1020 TaxID=3057343 RepID=UPI002915CA55|nr:hypothetical protein [Bradyrhizobium sp. SZCCHNR1020]